MRKRIIVGLATVAVFGAILMLARVTSTPSMSLLYSGLEPSISGEVIAALEKQGAFYKIDGSAIYVSASERDQLRMTLAGEGLPATGVAGYELLDKLSGFGTTAQMFDAAYWRAKEGELARTILTWPEVRSARVHISNQVARPFAKTPAPVASVTLKLSGAPLSDSKVRALRFLIASAVSGLSPENVSVIDSDRGLVARAGASGSGSGFADSRAKALKASVEQLLAARVGPGNARVEVAIDATNEKETIVEKRIDPKSRVAISTDTRETSANTADNGGTPVTVASNLPSGNTSGSNSTAKSNNTETRELINYEISQTTRKLIRQPDTIKRLSVAVLINGITTPGANPAWAPRSDAELTSLRELVQSTVGFNAERGDVVTIKSLEFLPLPVVGTLATPSPFAAVAANSMTLIQTGVLALVILGLGMFVVRPILTSPRLTALPGPDTAGMDGAFPAMEDELQFAIAGPDDALSDGFSSDPVSQLRQIIAERQGETVDVLRNWIETSEESA